MVEMVPQLPGQGGEGFHPLSTLAARIRATIRRDPIGWASTCGIKLRPYQRLRWGVPDGARGPDGELIHDDYILADALTAMLDKMEWHVSTGGIAAIEGFDPLERSLEDYYSYDCFLSQPLPE